LFQVFVQKTGFQRQKNFRLEDHHYIIKIKEKKSSTLPLLKDIVLILDKSLIKVIEELQTFYDKTESHIIYITFHQPGMISAVRSEGMDLWEKPSQIISHVMNSFNMFANSQDSLKLNNGFQVFIKVLSHENVLKGSRRRKTPLKMTLGCTKIFEEANIRLNQVLLIEAKFEKKFPNCCLLTSFILAFKHVTEGIGQLYKDYQSLWSSADHSLTDIAKSEALMQASVHDIQLKLALPSEGPYCSSLLEKLATLFNVQINLIKNCQEKYLAYNSYPFEFDSTKRQIFLLQVSPGHVVPLISVKAYFQKSKKQICLLCKKTFYCSYKHSCVHKKKQCQLCFCPLAIKDTVTQHDFVYCFSQIETDKIDKLCHACNQTFTSSTCFENHKRLVCKRKRSKCVTCKKIIFAANQHYCNVDAQQTFCSTCKIFYGEDTVHHCPLKQQKHSDFWPKLVFFDFTFLRPYSEHSKPIACSVLSEKENGIFENVVFFNEMAPTKGDNFSFVYDVDSKNPAKTKTKNTPLSPETKNMLNFLKCKKAAKSCVEYFLEFVLHPQNRHAVFLSSNENSQNMSLVLKMLTEANLIPRVVKKMNTFVLLKLKNLDITFLNVTNFFHGSKPDIADQFSFPDPLVFFPLYLKDESQTKPQYSDFTHWIDSTKTLQEKQKFFQQIRSNWNFHNELLRFASQQTKIVAYACLNFLLEAFHFQKKTFEFLSKPNEFYIFPFQNETPTLASYSYALLRYFYLNNERLVSSPKENICQQNNMSREELEFVLFMEYTYPQNKWIHSFSRPSGQKKFKQFSVDLFSPVTLEIYQFCGCFIHCHLPPKCKSPARQHLTAANINSTFQYKTYEEHLFNRNTFETFLKENCSGQYKQIIYVYECEWNIFKKTEDYLDFLSTQSGTSQLKRPLVRLMPRTAQRGGLTETYQFSWSQETSPSSNLMFLDVVSMYPYCGINFDFPVGMPQVIMGSQLRYVTVEQNQICYQNVPLTLGLIFCEMLAPQNLDWPFLQFRVKESVFLSLCRSCCIGQKPKCQHRKEKSRSFTSTWTLIEINKAISLGYQVLNVYEILYFKEGKAVFKEFLSTLSSLRLLNSYDGSDKEMFCAKINTDLKLCGTAFEVKPSELCSNPMKKSFYKLMLNSVLGKLSSLNQHETSEIVESQGQLELLLSKHDLSEINVIDENHVMVSYVDKFTKPQNNYNIYLGSYVSAYAKIVLYDLMLQLKSLNYPLYAIDTDCLLFELPKHCQNPFPVSYTPGSLKPVLDDCEILNFCSLGTRNYSIVYKDAKDVVKTLIKCKGLSLKSASLNNKLSYSLYLDFLKTYLNNELESIQLKQIKHKTQKDLSKREVETRFTFHNKLFIKRIVNLNGTTCPYGYVLKK